MLRAQGPRVVIHANGHRPAHVRIFGDGEAKAGEAKMGLLGGADGAPGLVWADAMAPGEGRRAVRLVAEPRAFLFARWEEHPWPS